MMENHLGWYFITSLTLLAACGGGATGVPVSQPPPVGLFDLTSTQTSTLGSHAIDATTRSVAASTGTLNRAANSATIAGMSGSIDASRTHVTLNGGGKITLNKSGTSYVADYTAQPAVGHPTSGIIGVPTQTANLPAPGSATYTGSSKLQIIDGTSVFDLKGASSATANFGTGAIGITYSNLNGTKTGGTAAPVNVTNVGTLQITGATISGNTFGGGTAALTSSQVASTLSGNQTVSTSGGFFGPAALEVGGVNVIDDTASTGSLLLLGSFIGKK